MERRQQGLGAVYRRRDGRWEGQIRIRGDPRRSFYARTRKDAMLNARTTAWHTIGSTAPLTSPLPLRGSLTRTQWRVSAVFTRAK